MPPSVTMLVRRLAPPKQVRRATTGMPATRMRTSKSSNTTAAHTDAPDRLESWKEIANYLGRTVRTVQRWEMEEGLPVRRHLHHCAASVYALRTEIDSWRVKRTTEPSRPTISVGARLPAAGGDLPREAYRHFVRGRHFANKRSREGLVAAIQEFKRALDCEPAWPMPYCGIAEAYLMLSGNEYWPPHDGFPKARAIALDALKLDPDLAAAHTAVGFVDAFYDAEWTRAIEHFEIAVRLDRHYPNAHYWHGMVSMNVGRFDEAVEKIQHAAELAPLSPPIVTNVGRPLLCAGRVEEAMRWFHRALEMDPAFWIAHLCLSYALDALGRFGEAMDSLEHALRAGGNVSGVTASIAYLQARAGRVQAAREMLRSLEPQIPGRYISPIRIARIYAAMGDDDSAIDWLERGCGDRSILNNTYILYDHAFARLRDDPRFLALIRQHLRLPLPHSL